MDRKYQVFFSALAGAVVMGILVPYFAFAHVGSSTGTVDSKTWMSNIDDNTKLDMISLPGSHDSGAKYSIGDVAGKCQDISIYDQLNIGTRYLDIRLQEVSNDFTVCHGIINEDLTFRNVMDDCQKFLNQYSTEAIVLSIKKEANTLTSSISFDDLLLNQLNEYRDIFYTGTSIPKLKDIRGKVCIMARYADSTIGIPSYNGWGDSTTFEMNTTVKMHVQDYFRVDTIDKKLSEITNCLDYSSNYMTAHTEDTLTINFFSGYFTNSFPPTYSVPVAKEINAWALDNLDKYSSTGIAVFDFITPELAKAVWSKNV